MKFREIRRRVSAFVGGWLLLLPCLVAAEQPVADVPGNIWPCSAVGSGDAALLPADRLAGVVNRFMGLYSTHVLGLVQTKERVYLLGTGNITSQVGLRADVLSVSPASHEFVSQLHEFRVAAGSARSGATGFICLRTPDAGRHGLAQDGQGEVMLAAGASVSLFDPADPALTVELKAAERSAMNLRDIAALSGRMGIYAGLMRSRGQRDASIAVQGADGRIAFRAIPEVLPAVAERGTVTLAVAAAPAERPAASEKAAVTEPRAPVPAAGPVIAEVAIAAAAPVESVPPKPAAAGVSPIAIASRDVGYENAMRKLMERQGGSVRSVSALTQVHPAVDALRNLMRQQ
jgi:hypothetical protein